MEEYDLIVIGSGPAGEKAAVRAAFNNKRVAIIERERMYGGAGTQTGTIPSKTLKETAIYLSGIREKGVYGVERRLEHSAGIKDFYYRKDHVSAMSSRDIHQSLLEHEVEIYRGSGSFVDPHTVEVKGVHNTRIHGKHILIATGSYPYHVPGIPFDGRHVHDSDTILTLDRFPESLVIVGAGVIGCEYATIFGVMGTRVTLINTAPDFLTFLDREIVHKLKEYMEANGVRFVLGATVDEVTIHQKNGRSRVHAHLDNGDPLDADMFLYAAGRSGNIAGLNLEAAGVETGPRETVVVNEQYRTNVEHIYAVGDVIGFPALASTSMDQGRAAVATMFDLDDMREIDNQFPYGIYTIPEVSCVGLTEEECKEKGINYGVGRAYVEQMARGRIMGYTKGLLKLIYDRESQAVIGVHAISAIATELIHFGTLLVEEKISLYRCLSMVYNYPTLHELYKYAAYDAFTREKRQKQGG